MAGIRILAPEEPLRLTPGRGFSIAVDVVNDSASYQQLQARLVGLPNEGISVHPALMTLPPGGAGSFAIDGELPAIYPAGEQRLGVRVSSPTQPELAVLADIDMNVPDLSQVRFDLDPSVVNAGRGRVKVRLTNEAPIPMDVALSGWDPEEAVKFRFEPWEMSIDPGEVRISRLTLTARRKLMGEPVRRVVHVELDGPGQTRTRRVTFVQKPWIPRLIGMAFILATVISLVFIGIFWMLDQVVNDSKPALSGRVVSAVEGTALPDTLIILSPATEDTLTAEVVAGLTISGDGGRYEVFDVEPGTYTVTFIKENFTSQVREIELTSRDADAVVDVQLVPEILDAPAPAPAPTDTTVAP